MENKTCYICLPISNHEDTVFERAEKACYEVVKLGYTPITPMEINNETPESIYDHSKKGSTEMGNDIRVLLECDAIYCCGGFTQSKGCMTEYNCAKIYGKKIFYQFGNPEESLLHNINHLYYKLVAIYKEANRINDIDAIRESKKRIEKFNKDIKENFNLELNTWEFEEIREY